MHSGSIYPSIFIISKLSSCVSPPTTEGSDTPEQNLEFTESQLKAIIKMSILWYNSIKFYANKIPDCVYN